MTFHKGARVGQSDGSQDIDWSAAAGSGALFKNTDKTHPSDSDLLGRVTTPDGAQFRVQAWWKPGHSGIRFLKLKLL
jgi:hypothetical protein